MERSAFIYKTLTSQRNCFDVTLSLSSFYKTSLLDYFTILSLDLPLRVILLESK